MNKEDKKDLLRLITAGSVDDGKSTLIGRLLYDTKSIFEDQLHSINQASTNKGKKEIDLSMFTDGLKDERELGITIDVAYKYFSTKKRKFILADTPGHYEFTRNMITGASTASLALLLIDATKGVVDQTKRHAYLASLLGLSNIIVCVNKMDLVSFSEEIFEEIVEEFLKFSSSFSKNKIVFIPISALQGDNVVSISKKMLWYKGASLLETLELVPSKSEDYEISTRLPIQLTIPHLENSNNPEIRYAGKLASGCLKTGDRISVPTSGITSTIKNIYLHGEKIAEAFAPMSISISLEDNITIKRGEIISSFQNSMRSSKELNLMICWLMEQSLKTNVEYLIKHGTQTATGKISSIDYKIDINTASKESENKYVGMNDIAMVQLVLTEEITFDSYKENRITGSLIIIDPESNLTLAAGIL